VRILHGGEVGRLTGAGRLFVGFRRLNYVGFFEVVDRCERGERGGVALLGGGGGWGVGGEVGAVAKCVRS
jgi:hypothetical protein